MSDWERSITLKMFDSLAEIEQWRASLPNDQRRKLNHPNAVISRWRRASARAPRQPVRGNHGRHGPGVYWPQDFVERAAEAIRDARTNDCCVMARRALEGAVRGAEDLRELLAASHAAAPTARRRETTAQVAA
jgi:hypothetical protein